MASLFLDLCLWYYTIVLVGDLDDRNNYKYKPSSK
jgi:hypothetical protein